FGLGTSTMIRLACIESLFLSNQKKISKETIRKLSMRGKTSGVGVRTYFEGGYVFDIGHAKFNDKLQPSSKRESKTTESLLVLNERMPKWKLGICIPKNIKRKSEAEEKKFFDENTPIADSSVHETLYHCI